MTIHPTTTRYTYIKPDLIQCVDVEETGDSEYPYSYTVWQTSAIHMFLAKWDCKNRLDKDLGLVKDYKVSRFN